MTTPYVGGPSDEYIALCSYGQPGAPRCRARATIHLLVNAPQYGVVGLSSCDGHEAIARASAPVLGEHPHQGLCDLPATRWADARRATRPARTAA